MKSDKWQARSDSDYTLCSQLGRGNKANLKIISQKLNSVK